MTEERTSTEKQEETLEQALERTYDEQDVDETEEITAEADETTEEVTAEAEETEEEAPVYDEPAPENWPEEIKTTYNALTPEAKKAMMDGVYKPMQRAYTDKTQELARMREQLKPMMEVMDRHSKDFETAGISPVEALNRQLEWSAHFARVGPEQGAKDLAAAYGQDTQGQSDQYLTPFEKQQKMELDTLKRQLQGVRQTDEQRQQQAQQAQIEQYTNSVKQSIHEFETSMENGKLVHPHVKKVAERMAGLMRGGLVETKDMFGQPLPYSQQLENAYAEACKNAGLNTSVTKSKLEQVNRAKAANHGVVSKTPGSDVEMPAKSFDEQLKETYAQLDRSVA